MRPAGGFVFGVCSCVRKTRPATFAAALAPNCSSDPVAGQKRNHAEKWICAKKLLCSRADVELGAELECVLNAELELALEAALEAELADGLNRA